MTNFFLIRHGTNDHIGKALAGRIPGVHLNAEGRAQAELLASRLANERIEQIFSSPLERCLETAEPFAKSSGLKIEILPTLIEVDYGDWNGKTMEQLRENEIWKQWNSFRSTTRIPNGETALEIQARMVGQIQRLHARFPNQALAIFSHGDPIKSVISFYLGISLEFMHRIEISPASVSLFSLSDSTAQLVYLNDRTAVGS